MYKKSSLLIFCLFSVVALIAQPTNDECVNAIEITDVVNWCSVPDAFTTVNATISADANPMCFPTNADVFDVWFSFEAVAANVSIDVVGETNINDGGTIQDPQFALYAGDCSNLTLLTCQSDATDADYIGVYETGLAVGETYYIRVSARYNQTGTFQLCVNNYSEVPPPDGDCASAVILCDKDPFTVGFLAGVGNTPNEIGDVSCNNNGACDFDESSSTWYKWTCLESGPLAFTLTPQNPADDLDFVLYELPNGLDDCDNKQDLRCMASGENINDPFVNWAPCTGPTGLSLADPDDSETCGCQAGDNNFARALDMVAGRTYAIVVNNFSQSGAGFSIEFDQSPGTGTFVGPEADFTFDPNISCVGETVTFTDASSFIGNIEGHEWNFGDGAVPQTATGPGPHQVVYSTPGLKPVVLEVTAERGCIVTRIDLATEVICCEDHFTESAVVSDVDCPNSTDGSIDISVMSDYAPFIYLWDTGTGSEDLNNLSPGTYMVTVTDDATCQDEFTYIIDSPPPFTFDTLVVMPTCNGGTDGSVTLNVTGGTPPYEFNWQNTGFSPDNFFNNISQGDYSITIRDANGCIVNQILPVRELELLLDPNVQTITQPSCFGFSDGSIVIAINNGLPPYEYDFNQGGGFMPNNTLSNIPAGTYMVDVLDANLCSGFFELVVEDHPPLTIDLTVTDVSCFGESDGSIAAVVGGGFGSYTYDWNNGGNAATIDNLVAGTYSVDVEDENGCQIDDTAIVIQPDSLGLDLVEVVDNICFGESNGSITVAAVGGLPPYEYSVDGFTFQDDPTLTGLAAGTYEVTVLDGNDCTATVEAIVLEPAQLIVDAGDDRFIVLGYDTLIRAVSNYSPVTYEWSPVDSLQCLNADCSQVFVNPTTTTAYTVTAINENSCTATDEVIIRVIKDRPIYVPNVFSPNDDGLNDGFTVFSGPGLEKIEKLQVFSRWGSLVFETNDIDPNQEGLGWDGRFKGELVNPGVFVYVAQLRFVDKETLLVEGDVTLIR